MKTFYGPFRALERSFVSYVSGVNPGPQRAILVLCPSGRVAEYLKTQLVKQHGFISNVFFVTFAQLLSILDSQIVPLRKPLLPGDNLHDYLLKNLLSMPGLDRYHISRGFIGAVRSSLRDMADSLAQADILEEYLSGMTDPKLLEEKEHFAWLTQVYRVYQEKMDQIEGYRSYQTYFEDALQQLEQSAWLSGFADIIVYGFYELTGRQLEVFHALRRHYGVTVFWPYQAHPAFAFGRKFFETNILGLSGEVQPVEQQYDLLAAGPVLEKLFTTQSVNKTPSGLHVISTPNPEQELIFAVKEMQRLHEEKQIAYADMAVMAHSMEPYKSLLPDIWAQNGVPLQADFTFAWHTRSLGVFVTNLLSLARNGFDREDLLAVVSSPYFRHCHAWRYLIKESLARRDYAQWLDLLQPTVKFYDPQFLTWLTHTKEQLDALEKAASWEELRSRALAFLEENTDTAHLSAQEQNTWQTLTEVLQGFARYSAISEQAHAREFLDELFAKLQTQEFHQVIDMPAGVTVAEVGSLRGIGFRVVFVLGLNEKSFPQMIREDPVLKDSFRLVLRDRLGFWMNAKMERFEEERLLFFGAVESAREQLYLSFLRTDEEGKPLVPSSYLIELTRATHTDLSGSLVTYISSQPVKPADFTRLTPKELSWRLAAEHSPEQLYQTAGLWNESMSDTQQAARQLSGMGAVHERDGMIASGQEIFKDQQAHGFSASALQDLARCPMKYFFSKGVGLKDPDEAFSRSELAPNLRGDIYHQVLMDYYSHLLAEGLTGQLFDSALQERLDRALHSHYTAGSYKQFGIYPVIWDLILADIQGKLSAFIQQDNQEMGNYVPSLFETYFEKMYEPSAQLKLKLKGIIDRIDIDKQHHTFRIVDYKSGRHGGQDLSTDMFKHVILQPFIYLILASDTAQTNGLTPNGAVLLNINKGYAHQDLTAAGFESVQEKAAQFFGLLKQLIEQGQFFISPGDHCAYCPYAAICRKDSFHSLMRARHARLAQQLQEIKQ